MRIEQDLKLDFKDVLIRPKRSTLTSRSEVDISRDFVFLHSQRKYHGIPIIAANMDATGTFEMARALARHELSVALHKHYDEAQILAFFAEQAGHRGTFYSMGIMSPDYEKFRRVMDVTNGAHDGPPSVLLGQSFSQPAVGSFLADASVYLPANADHITGETSQGSATGTEKDLGVPVATAQLSLRPGDSTSITVRPPQPASRQSAAANGRHQVAALIGQ